MPQPPLSPTSTVLQLLYTVAPRLRLPALASQLCRMLPDGPGTPPRIARAGANTLHIDLATARLSLAFHRELGSRIAACLTLAVGPRPDAAQAAVPAATLAGDQARLARRLAAAISARHAPAQTIWHITPAALSSALIDDLLRSLPRNLPLSGADAENDAVDMTRVLAQIEQTLAGKRSSRPAPLRRAAGQGFAMRWPQDAHKMMCQPANAAMRPAPRNRAPALQAAANSLPAVPGPDHAGRKRAVTALGQDIAHTRLILSYGSCRHTMALRAPA